MMPQSADRVFDGAPDFDSAILPNLEARPFFRLATDEEVARSFAEYRKNDFESLLNIWSKVAAPTRAELGRLQPFYARAGWLPSVWNGLAFLASLQTVDTMACRPAPPGAPAAVVYATGVPVDAPTVAWKPNGFGMVAGVAAARGGVITDPSGWVP